MMNELEEINIETLRKLNYRQRMQIIAIRNDWLQRQRLQDKKEQLSRQRKKYNTKFNKKWVEKGLCPACKEHEIIFKAKLCLQCYGAMLQAHRKYRKKKKTKKIY